MPYKSSSAASDVDLGGSTCASSGQCSGPAARGTAAESVAKRKPEQPASTIPGEENDRELPAGASRPARP